MLGCGLGPRLTRQHLGHSSSSRRLGFRSFCSCGPSGSSHEGQRMALSPILQSRRIPPRQKVTNWVRLRGADTLVPRRDGARRPDLFPSFSLDTTGKIKNDGQKCLHCTCSIFRNGSVLQQLREVAVVIIHSAVMHELEDFVHLLPIFAIHIVELDRNA